MNKIILYLFLIVCSQNVFSQKTIFIRVYDTDGVKIAKGNFREITDTSLTLTLKRKDITIPLHDIARIRTKRSIGHDILIFSLVTGSLGGIMGGSFASEPATSGNTFGGVVLGTLIGAYAGSAMGGVAGMIKKSRKFEINGTADKWQIFKEFMELRQANKKMLAPAAN